MPFDLSHKLRIWLQLHLGLIFQHAIPLHSAHKAPSIKAVTSLVVVQLWDFMRFQEDASFHMDISVEWAAKKNPAQFFGFWIATWAKPAPPPTLLSPKTKVSGPWHEWDASCTWHLCCWKHRKNENWWLESEHWRSSLDSMHSVLWEKNQEAKIVLARKWQNESKKLWLQEVMRCSSSLNFSHFCKRATVLNVACEHFSAYKSKHHQLGDLAWIEWKIWCWNPLSIQPTPHCRQKPDDIFFEPTESRKKCFWTHSNVATRTHLIAWAKRQKWIEEIDHSVVPRNRD